MIFHQIKTFLRFLLAISFLVFLFSNCSSPTAHFSPKDKMLYDAADFLWKKQNADGGWHSETHGILKSGQSVSAFVFYNLLQVPDTIYTPSEKQLKTGLKFLRKHIKDGVLGHFDPIILDYPNYATAYALRIFLHFNKKEDQALIQQMVDYLVEQQFDESRGFSAAHAAFGAWGFGEKFLEDGNHGHVDLSHTRRILQSLQLADYQDNRLYLNALSFFSILQKNTSDQRLHPTGIPSKYATYDGGFFASSVTVSTNKGDILDEENPIYRSYATATADGILGLLATGLPPSDRRVQDALHWLIEHDELEFPEGIPQDDPNQWHRVMFFYHLAVRGQTYRAMNYEEDWENDFVNILLEKQLEDGSFSNPMGAANKEDDPLIATSLVLQVFF